MKSKWTILLAVLMLMLGLAVTQVNAQGFNVSKSETDVAEHGRNQMMGAIRLDYTRTGGNIDDGRTIKVNYGGLRITHHVVRCCAPAASQDTGAALPVCRRIRTPDGACSGVTRDFANDKDTGVGTVTINDGDRQARFRRVRVCRSERRPSGRFGSVCRRHDRGLHQFLDGPDRFRSHRSGQDRKRGRHGVHRHRRPRRCPRASQPAPVQHR